MLLKTSNISIDKIESALITEKQVYVSVLRLDKIHPVISGNKLFKLHYFLENALNSAHKTILTFGGAYSNHLVATAYACKLYSLKSIGIVRGERPLKLSHTLQHCIDYGMELQFIPRELFNYRNDPGVIRSITNIWGECEIVPDGGYQPLGAKGASLIMDHIKDTGATHICADIGTATTIAGLLMRTTADQKIFGISVLKGMTDIEDRIKYLTENKADLNQLELFHDYHFGGYAKKTPELITFINNFYRDHTIPMDFVYTGKLMYGVYDLIKKDKFPANSNITCIHSGGLQGNLSLPPGTLIFD